MWNVYLIDREDATITLVDRKFKRKTATAFVAKWNSRKRTAVAIGLPQTLGLPSLSLCPISLGRKSSRPEGTNVLAWPQPRPRRQRRQISR